MAEAALAGKTVLLLEDEPLIAFSIREELQDEGATVLSVRSCEAALEILQGQMVNCAALDFLLDGETCADVAVACREKRIPFIICTGAQHEQTELLGAAASLSKPFPVERLIRLIVQHGAGLPG